MKPVDSVEITITKEETDTVNKSVLESAIQNAVILKQSTPVGTSIGHAPEESHAALQQAIDAAQAVLNDDNATQAQVDNAVQALQEAVADFQAAVVVPADTTALTAAIAEAEGWLADTGKGIYHGQAPVHAHAALQAAIDAAMAVRDDADARQADINAAAADLQQTIAAFQTEIVTVDDPLAVHLFNIDSSFTADNAEVSFNTAPKYLKTEGSSIKLLLTQPSANLRITEAHPDGSLTGGPMTPSPCGSMWKMLISLIAPLPSSGVTARTMP